MCDIHQYLTRSAQIHIIIHKVISPKKRGVLTISNQIIKIEDYKEKKAKGDKKNILEKLGIEIDEEMLFEQCREEKRKEYDFYEINGKK